MPPERLQQIERIFHAALEVEGTRRGEFLNQACGNDHDLRREVESLLAYRTRAEAFIERPAMEMAAHQMARTTEAQGEVTQPATRWMPAAIGRYRILRVLGEGGMGVVYEAEQEQPRPTVALKVIRPGMASPELLRRFEQESRALARHSIPPSRRFTKPERRMRGSGRSPTLPWN